MRQAQAEPWAILPTALQSLLANAGILRADNDTLEIQALSRPGPKSGRVARLPIMGPITRRDSLWSLLFGGTSIERIIKALREVAADETIGTVLLDIDSPGGTVSGMPELAAEVRALRESKQVVALANSLTASAAYWMASQADEIIATPEALVGSVGVFAMHEDWSKFYEQNGVKISYISAGKYKTEGNFEEPLSDEAREHMQSIVDDAYALFVGDVARGRAISPSRVRAEYGEGRVLVAKDAKTAGMIDRVATAGETVRRLTGIKAEHDLPIEAADDDGVNSQARSALMRRRLELAQIYFEEE
jgi:signal peptide peptidase SppA